MRILNLALLGLIALVGFTAIPEQAEARCGGASAGRGGGFLHRLFHRQTSAYASASNSTCSTCTTASCATASAPQMCANYGQCGGGCANCPNCTQCAGYNQQVQFYYPTAAKYPNCPECEKSYQEQMKVRSAAPQRMPQPAPAPDYPRQVENPQPAQNSGRQMMCMNGFYYPVP